MGFLDLIIRLTNEASPGVQALTGDLTNLDRVTGTASDGFSGLQSVVSGGLVAAAGLATAAFGALGYAFSDSLDLAREQGDVEAQLAAVLKSTGGAVGMTASELTGLAEELESVTNFSDQTIIAGENMLLTFTNIGSDVFPRATETMLDMSQALDTDLKGSAIQLGKALNDPIEGVSALSRVGVTFTDEQKTMIATMVEAGDVAGAQGLILDELAREFGGSATALADPAEQLQNAWVNFKETIGGAVLPIVESLYAEALPYVTAAIEAVQLPLQYVTEAFQDLVAGDTAGFFQNLQVAAFGFGQAMGVPVTTIREFIARIVEFVTNAQQMIDSFALFIAPIATAVASFVSWQDVLAAVGVVVASVVVPALISIVAAAAPVIAVGVALVAGIALVRTAWEEDWGGIQEKVQAVIDYVVPLINNAIAFIKTWWAQNGDEILAKASEIWESVKTAVQTAVTTASDIVTSIYTTLAAFWATNGDAILAKAGEIWTGITTAVTAAINAVQTIITTVYTAISTFWATNGDTILTTAETVWTDIQTAIETAITAVQTTITAVANGIATFWQVHGTTITTIATTVWAFIQTSVSNAMLFISGIISAFSAAIAGDWTAFGEGLRTSWDAFWAQIQNALSTAGTLLSTILNGIVTTLLGWFDTLKTDAGTKVQGMIDSIFTSFSGASWGSIGSGIVNGIAAGISGGVGAITSAATSAAQAALDAAKGFLGIESPSRVTSAQIGLPYVQGIVAGVTGSLGLINDAVTAVSQSLMPVQLPAPVMPDMSAIENSDFFKMFSSIGASPALPKMPNFQDSDFFRMFNSIGGGVNPFIPSPSLSQLSPVGGGGFIPTPGSVGAPLSPQGQNITITIDARGASDEARIEEAGFRGAKRALEQLGIRTDTLIRRRVG